MWLILVSSMIITSSHEDSWFCWSCGDDCAGKGQGERFSSDELPNDPLADGMLETSWSFNHINSVSDKFGWKIL